ncbi:hypothetical protein GY45DRAFT_1438587 [Cubamyces sp. BRFM 1775]|nr:hypothetical protein GY45DRAFT_1438587 [Cubamyces sp. BRFM 1775]
MPGLIHRYNAVAEYSALVSTNPSSINRRRLQRVPKHEITSTRATLSDEAAEWYDAVCPPLEEVQDAIRRFQSDPDFTQDRTFAFLAPLFVFGALFVVAMVAVQPHSFAHRILDAPGDHTQDIAKVAGILLGGVLFSLVILRCTIWGVSEISTVVVSLESREERRNRERSGIPSSNLVLGGMFM